MTRADVAVILGVVALVPAVYSAMLPPLSRVRAAAAEEDLAQGLAAATVTSTVAVTAIAAGLRSWPVAVYGGAMVAAYAVLYSKAFVA